jgi:hypothetical protein
MESENAPVEPQPKRGYVMIDVILKSGFVLSSYSYADNYGFNFSQVTGECTHWHMEIPKGQPKIDMSCNEIAAVKITQVEDLEWEKFI